MSSIAEDLQGLNFEGVEEFAVDDDSYVDPAQRRLLPEADYLVQLDGVGIDKDNDGKPRLARGKYPTIKISRITVAQPEQFAGQIATFDERVYSVPFERNGSKASGLADMTRSLDQTRTWRQIPEGLQLAVELAEGGHFAKVRVGWEAYDKDHYEALVSAAGGESLVDDKQKKQFRKDATIKGMKKFPRLPDGSYSPEIEGPSGAILEARTRINTWYSSAKALKF